MKTDALLIKSIIQDIERRRIEIGVSDDPAWPDFFRTYDPMIRSFVRASGVSTMVAVDECTQEVWLAVIQGMTRFVIRPKKGRFRTWLFAIARRKVIDYRHGVNRRSGVSLNDSVASIPVPTDPAASPTEHLETKLEQAIVREVLEEVRVQVSDQSFKIFWARRFAGHNVAEVAEMFQVSSGVVRICQHRVQKRLETALKRRLKVR